MNLSNQLTIVIPCKNEKNIVQKTLDLLNYQLDITGVKVIICDSSNDGVTKNDLINRSYKKTDKFDLYVTIGALS